MKIGMSDSAMKGGRSSPARRPSSSRDCGSSTKLSGSDARRPCGATSPGSSPRHTPATRPTSSKLSAGSRPAAASPSRQQRRSASRKFVSVTTHEHVGVGGMAHRTAAPRWQTPVHNEEDDGAVSSLALRNTSPHRRWRRRSELGADGIRFTVQGVDGK